MIIHNFDIVSAVVQPTKTYSELVVDPETVLAGAIALQLLQSISRRISKVFEPLRKAQIAQTASRNTRNVSKFAALCRFEYLACFVILETHDHE